MLQKYGRVIRMENIGNWRSQEGNAATEEQGSGTFRISGDLVNGRTAQKSKDAADGDETLQEARRKRQHLSDIHSGSLLCSLKIHTFFDNNPLAPQFSSNFLHSPIH